MGADRESDEFRLQSASPMQGRAEDALRGWRSAGSRAANVGRGEGGVSPTWLEC
jgi:hypothetical protein